MSRILLIKLSDNSWEDQSGTIWPLVKIDDNYYIGTRVWINTITKSIDSNPIPSEPSVIETDESDENKEWWVNGKLHREDGPAVEYGDGSGEWWVNGQLHREDGPAVEWSEDGYKAWYLNGERHREDGPAVQKLDGSEEWYLNGKLHRIGGPAVVFSNGRKDWYIHGLLHREDGPAVEFRDGSKAWYIRGELHRIDGPALECRDDGYKEWWVNGVEYTEEEYNSQAILDIRSKYASILVKSADLK